MTAGEKGSATPTNRGLCHEGSATVLNQRTIMPAARPFGAGARPRGAWAISGAWATPAVSSAAKTEAVNHARDVWPLDSLGGSTG